MILNRTQLATGLCVLYSLAVVIATAGPFFSMESGWGAGFQAQTAYTSVLCLQLLQMLYWKWFGPAEPDEAGTALTIMLNWFLLIGATIFLSSSLLHFFLDREIPAALSAVLPYYYSSGIVYFIITLPALVFWRRATRTDLHQTFIWVLILAILQALANFGEYWILMGF